MMSRSIPQHIIHFPRWYPGLHNEQAGIFIKKQIDSISEFKQSVIYVGSSRHRNIKLNKVLRHDNASVSTYLYYYAPGGSIKTILGYFIGMIACLKMAIKDSGKPVLLHAHVLLRTYIVAWLCSYLFGIKYVISEHWSGYHFKLLDRRSWFYGYLVKLTLQNAEKIIVVSERLKESILMNFNIVGNKFEVIPNIAECTTQIKKTHRNGIRFVSVADLKDENKRLSEIIKALDLIHLSNLEYHVIGDGPDLAKLRELAGKATRLHVVFHGEKSNAEVLQLLPNFDIAVINSRYETFGIVALEAVLSGLPVICTTTGCPAEIQTKETGIFFDADDPVGLENALNQMIETYAFFDLTEIQQHIGFTFGKKEVGIRITKLYNKIINEQGN